ncbi:acyltransferase family protein [Chitinophaga sp. SYP-B3965]|uniref:acyltransferase family protein n=1 Tax=Chitinophaga sp. SYP-B3965 TaxID=2663120 RepID=UPI001299C8B7|nr:acyltransferase family protein [Chitinophaga sp. SYP-B3965]MRG44346.1 acyltransferase family protein [Chitinophaga sp. SYP-B3965]
MTLQQDNRIYGLDALRAVAMLLGVLLHTIIAYKVNVNPSWPSDNSLHSYFFDGTYYFIHSFRMQLFFVVAGFFARMVYLKIGQQAFIKARFKRIAIPFIGSLIFILPLSIAPFLYYKYYIADALPPAEAWAAFRHQFFRWNGMAHLWFLYYLLFFYGAMLVILHKRVQQLVPAFLKKGMLNMASLPHILVVGGVLGVIQLLFFAEPLVEVSNGIIPKVSHLLYYGFFFAIGVLVNKNAAQLKQIPQRTWLYLSVGLLLAVALFYIIVLQKDQTHPVGLWALKLGVAMQTTFLTFGIMGFFLRYMNQESRTFRYISDASYWLYLVHLIMVSSLQVLFLYTNIPGVLRIILILSITSGVSLLTYQWFIRYTFIGNVLHGPRKRG